MIAKNKVLQLDDARVDDHNVITVEKFDYAFEIYSFRVHLKIFVV